MEEATKDNGLRRTLATLVKHGWLKRGNTNVDIKFSEHERFWNNIHQVAQDQKIGKITSEWPTNLYMLE
jgi:hypothetical protein